MARRPNAHLEEEHVRGIDGRGAAPGAARRPPRDRGCLGRIVEHDGADPGAGRQPSLQEGGSRLGPETKPMTSCRKLEPDVSPDLCTVTIAEVRHVHKTCVLWTC